MDSDNIMEWAERYLNRSLNAETLVKINAELAADDDLRREWNKSIGFLTRLKNLGERERIKQMTAEIVKENSPQNTKSFKYKTVQFFKNYGKVTSMAASLALIASLVTYTLATNTSKIKSDTQFISLKREIQTIKNSQARLDRSLDEVTKDQKTIATVHQGDEVGTGFAISNDGFLATDYHVVSDADSIFVQTSNGKFYKSYIVAYDAENDLAVLKIDDKNFKFGKGKIPYSFANNDAPLAQQIYSIGFPQDEALYTEGYVSSKLGYEGSEHSYQLNMPANPGQSGAPVFDKNGNIIAMVIGKKTYATYAIKSKMLLEMMQQFPTTKNITLNSHNSLAGLSRTEQVKTALDYVCAVRVYK